jgi:uncharacterized protein (DUF1330 family)
MGAVAYRLLYAMRLLRKLSSRDVRALLKRSANYDRLFAFIWRKDMPKGYIIARVTVEDAERYAQYAQGSGAAMEKYGARVLVRAGRYEALEGDARARNVVLEFESFEAARAYYHSPEYQAAREHRVGAAQGEFLLVEGFDPA